MKLGSTSISTVHRIAKKLKRFWVVSLLLIVFLASSWALLRPGFFRVHDYIHAARIAEITQALQDGHIPVRWSQNFGFGYGMPLFEFYAPLPFYVGSLFYWLGVSVVTSVKLLFLISNLGTLVGGFLLGKKLFGKTGGVVTSAALTLAPYRAVNLFVRGALSEAWGIMFLPWILLGIVLVVDQNESKTTSKTGWIMLVTGLVGLMLSHNLTTMMFVPLSIVFGGCYLIWKWQRSSSLSFISSFLVLAGSYILAVGTSSFYLFPALTENSFTQIDSILGGYFHYSQHFLYIRQFFQPSWGYGGSQWGPDDGISFFLGFGQLLAVIISGLLFIKTVVKKNITFNHLLFVVLSGLLGVSLFMSLFKSAFIWDSLSFLSFIQFPWRWLSPAILFTALLAGLGVAFIKNTAKRVLYGWIIVLFLVLTNFFYFQPESYLEDVDSLYYTDADRIQQHMSQILPDYIPIQMSQELTPPTQLVETTAESNVLVEKTHQKLVSVKSDQPVVVSFLVADFPGWQVEIDGQPRPDTKQVSDTGTIDVLAPAGEHLIGIYFGSTPVRQISDLISLASIVVFGFFAVKATHENA